MIPKEVGALLTEGLLTGYAGKNSGGVVNEDPFTFQTSQFNGEEGHCYIDKWTLGKTGFGYEMVVVDGKVFARLYFGGVDKDQLDKLAVSEPSVMGFLIESIKDLQEGTRFDRPAMRQKGDWSYSYNPTKNNQEPEFGVLASGREVITYKEKEVFMHRVFLVEVG